jgi:hypothetical protein
MEPKKVVFNRQIGGGVDTVNPPKKEKGLVGVGVIKHTLEEMVQLFGWQTNEVVWDIAWSGKVDGAPFLITSQERVRRWRQEVSWLIEAKRGGAAADLFDFYIDILNDEPCC